MSANSPEPSLTIPDFDPENLELADVFLSSDPRPTVARGAPAMISVGLNGADVRFVCVNIDPPGEPPVASVREDPRLTHSVWFDLRPAEALVLSARLRICAEAAAQFAEAVRGEPNDAGRRG